MIQEEIRQYLATQMPGKTIKRDQLGPDPVNQIVVMRTYGTSTIRSEVKEYFIKILSRNTDSDNAEADIQTVYGHLHNKSGILTTPTQIVKASNLPFLVGQDENFHYIYSVNFLVRSL